LSPNYPGNYPDFADCHWMITVPIGHVVVLMAPVSFTIESGVLNDSCADKLKVSEVLNMLLLK